MTLQFVQSHACRPRQQKYNAVPAQAQSVKCYTLSSNALAAMDILRSKKEQRFSSGAYGALLG